MQHDVGQLKSLYIWPVGQGLPILSVDSDELQATTLTESQTDNPFIYICFILTHHYQ